MMTVVFTVMTFNPEGWRSVWKAKRHFKDYPDPLKGVLLVWSLLIVWAGGRFIWRIFKTVFSRPDPPLP
jgi:hypothetical protein